MYFFFGASEVFRGIQSGAEMTAQGSILTFKINVQNIVLEEVCVYCLQSISAISV